MGLTQKIRDHSDDSFERFDFDFQENFSDEDFFEKELSGEAKELFKKLGRNPTSEDLRANNIRKTLRNELQKNEGSLAAYVCLGLGIFLPFINLTPIGIVLGAIGLVILAKNWFKPLFRRDEMEASYGNLLREIQDFQSLQKRFEIKQELNQFINVPRLGEHALRGKEQFDSLLNKFRSLISNLGKRFSTSNDLTYMKYSSDAQRVLDSAMENLHDIVLSLQNLSDMDLDRIKSSLSEYEGKTKLSEFEQAEFDSWKDRFKIFQEEIEKVKRLFGKNEQAMTLIDRTTQKVGSIKTKDDSIIEKIDASMANLLDAMKKLSNYDRSSQEDIFADDYQN